VHPKLLGGSKHILTLVASRLTTRRFEGPDGGIMVEQGLITGFGGYNRGVAVTDADFASDENFKATAVTTNL